MADKEPGLRGWDERRLALEHDQRRRKGEHEEYKPHLIKDVYVIMRSDLSSVLNENDGQCITFSSFESAYKAAQNYNGVVVPFEEAKRIMKEKS
jgi:hypothetical protein